MNLLDWIRFKFGPPGRFTVERMPHGGYYATWRFENSHFSFSSESKKFAVDVVTEYARAIVKYKKDHP